MPRPRFPICVSLLCVAMLPGLCRAEGVALAGISLGPPHDRTLTNDPWKGWTVREQDAVFSLGTPYGIKYTVAFRPEEPGVMRPIEGYIGMPVPTSCNWYQAGFMTIAVNGKDLGATPLSSMAVAERDTRAILDLVWRDELADVRARFVGLPGEDHLMCEIALDPKVEITSLSVGLTCYPSYFTSWNNREGARRVQTPGAVVEQGAPQTLAAKDGWWGVYYDEVFDVAKGEGEGPCAMMLAPGEATEVSIAPGGYAVTTTIAYPAGTRLARLAFWDFQGKTNAWALARIRDHAEELRGRLATEDFTPACVKSFDFAALKAEVERAVASEAAQAMLGEKIARAQEWLQTQAPAPERGRSIRAQEQLVGSVNAYYDFMWEVKLAELLEGL